MAKATKRTFFALFLLPVLALFGACGGGEDNDAGEPTRAATATAGSGNSAASPTVASTGSSTTTASGANVTAQKLTALKVPYEMADGFYLGSPTAKVTVSVYEDFQCPFCLSYTANTEPTIVNEYVKTGKVRLQFQNLPILGQESVLAAFAGYCAAEQNLFWKLHGKLFLVQAEANQLTDEKLNVGRFSAEKLVSYAEEIGVESATFSACLEAQTTVDGLTKQVADAQTFGFRGTPSFAINGVAQPGQPSSLAAWRKLLDESISAAK